MIRIMGFFLDAFVVALLFYAVVLFIGDANSSKPSTIYKGQYLDIATINSECKARNAGESVWIGCSVFFEGKRLTKTR